MAYTTETQKLDKQAVNGLLGVQDSLAYKVNEIERHLHSYERWFGLAVTPNAEIHRADLLNTYTNLNIVAPFVIDAGNDNFGAWVQVLGSSDTPCIVGSDFYDMHTFAFSGNERAGVYFVQIAFGTSGAAALTAGTYTANCIGFDATNYQKEHIFQARRVAVGTKAWVRCLCPGQNTATLNFYFGIHEYEG